MDDPSVHRYEYEDPDRPGQLAIREVRTEKSEFVLRVPLMDGVDHIEFYRIDDMPGEVTKVAGARRSIGRIQLDSIGRGEE